jgi:hypothetical protein
VEDTNNTYSTKHPHEPEIPPSFDEEGRCLVCCLIVERDKYKRALDVLDSMNPNDFRTGQSQLTPAFREPNLKEAMRFVMRTVNGVLHNADEYGKPLN